MTSKAARARAREEEKSKNAFGGPTMLVVEGETATESSDREYEDLQWFRLLRGSARMNQIAAILVELAPNKVFDPRETYLQHCKAVSEIKMSNHEEDGGGKGEKRSSSAAAGNKKPPSKKDLIIAQNTARLQKEAAKRDEEKLNTLSTSRKREGIKLETEIGKLSHLAEMLKVSVKDQNVIDSLDTLWELEEVVRELGGETNEDVKALLKKHSDALTLARAIREDRSQLNKKSLVDFQLTEMSDRLPPLNLHALRGKFKLDDWQLRVIQMIEAGKSVLITAPTSSGKTVLSTFVCTGTAARVLFVVPTEPLAWQVAAMLRALKLGIALIVPTLNFVPPQFDVVVGTPHALESQLTKKLGFSEFSWAVFDEVHSLNNRDGEALQRIIAAMPRTCKFLALSATIGNAPELKRWWESIVGEGQIELVQHQARFINLQRHVWAPPQGLRLLHPLTCVDTTFLRENGFGHTDMAFTPVDAYKLWQAFDKYINHDDELSERFPVGDLKPRRYFSDDPLERITLQQAHQYEKALKERLEKLAREDPQTCDVVLKSIASGESLKRGKKKSSATTTTTTTTEGAGEPGTDESIATLMRLSNEATSVASLTDLVFELHRNSFTPAITFQLDSVRCQTLFDGMLKEIEAREHAAFPDYRVGLLRQQRGLEKQEKERSKRKSTAKEEGDQPDEATAQEFGEVSSAAVDVDAPHPDFTLAPPGKAIGLTDATDLRKRLRDDLPPTGEVAHPLVRALRRGVGVYVEGLPTSYHRVVQELAQRGALGVVFSDELLAYGVNMPFRSAVFFGDPGREWLTPLLHQQMAGRAGRRGLDRQGHLVYAGFTPDRLKELLRGELPDVVGRYPLYPTIPLQLEMNRRYKTMGAPLDEAKMQIICRTPLAEFLRGEKVEGYYDDAKKWIEALGVLKHPKSSYAYLITDMVWELRQHVAESLAIEYCLEPLVKLYKHAEVVKGDQDVNAQYSIFLVFCRLCSREPVRREWPREMGEMPSWYGALPSPHNRDEAWDAWTDVIRASQERITQVTGLVHGRDQLLLHPADVDQDLDNMCYSAFVRNQIDPSLPTPMQHDLRQRLFHVGEVLRIVSNILGRSAELQPVQNLMRKCFIRVRYILDETFEKNWKA